MPMSGPRLHDALKRALGRAASGRLVEDIAKRAADVTERLAFGQFGRGVDPYGHPWARAKHHAGAPLVRTGALANSFVTKLRGFKGFVLTATERYAFPLHFGWGTAEQLRRIVAAGRRAAELARLDEKKGKRALARVDRRMKKFDALTSRAPARRLMPEGDDAGEWEKPIADEITTTVAEALR